MLQVNLRCRVAGVAGVLAVLAGCDVFGPREPRFSGPGRFVLVSIAGAPLPHNVYQGGQGYTRLLADTLVLSDDGTARRVQVTYTSITWIGLGSRTDTATEVVRGTGTWRASGSEVRVAARAAYRGDTLRLRPRGGGGLELPGSVDAGPGWVWERR